MINEKRSVKLVPGGSQKRLSTVTYKSIKKTLPNIPGSSEFGNSEKRGEGSGQAKVYWKQKYFEPWTLKSIGGGSKRGSIGSLEGEADRKESLASQRQAMSRNVRKSLFLDESN